MFAQCKAEICELHDFLGRGLPVRWRTPMKIWNYPFFIEKMIVTQVLAY